MYTQGFPVLSTAACSALQLPFKNLHAFSQRSTQRTCPHSPASNSPRKDCHHGNSKWKELHTTDKDRGHCSPRNKSSYPRTTCGRNAHYISEDTCTHLLLLILIVCTVHTMQCRRLVITCTMATAYCTVLQIKCMTKRARNVWQTVLETRGLS